MRLENNHIAKLIREGVRSIDPSAQTIIFGSRARGDARKESDWDILILVDNPVTMVVETTFRNKLFDIEIETGEVFSTFIYQKKEWDTRHKVTPFYRNVKREGVIL